MSPSESEFRSSLYEHQLPYFRRQTSLHPILVTLYRRDKPEGRFALLRELKSWAGVEEVGDIQEDPEIPEISAYFFVYVDPAADVYAIINRLKDSPLVDSAEKPPLRTAVLPHR